MMEQFPVWNLFGVPIYGYSIFLCLSIILGLGLTAICQRKRNLPKDTALRYGLWAIPLAVAGARLFYCLIRLDFVLYEQDWTFIFSLWKGGFALYGALFGCVLAALIFSKAAKIQVGGILDCIAPGAALVIAGSRFAEALTTQGVGRLVEAEALQFFPFAVQNVYGDWVMPVFFYEGIAALAICFTAYRHLKRKNEKAGNTALLFLLLFGASQVLLESMREDDFLRWGFVKVSQLMSMGLILTVAVIFGIRVLAKKKTGPLAAAGFLMLAAGTGACVFLEFALDKSSIPNQYLYIAMAAILTLMTCIALAYWKAGRETPAKAAGELKA
jgi:phosphatidylglycerol:prolipoprotein diacylglycerol transferase